MDKLQKIRDLYAEDKLITNSPDYSLNEFFGTIQIGLKDIESKSLRVTKNPTMKYSVYDGDKEIAYLNNSKGTVYYDDSFFSRYNSIKQAAKKDPEKKQEINNILNNPNMSLFPIEEIDFTPEERQEMFRTVRGRMAGMVIKYYKSIYQDTLININYNSQTIPINFNGREDENDFNRLLRLEFGSAYDKYGVALAKFVLDEDLTDRDDLIDFKAALLQMLSQEGQDNVDETLNGLGVKEIIDKYGLSLATEEEAMISRIFNMEQRQGNYKIVPIKTYEDARKYNKYLTSPHLKGRNIPGAWCITYGSGHFGGYVNENRAELFYFLLREPDWDKIDEVPPHKSNDVKKHVFDDYGSSMIAVSIKRNGMIGVATSRYNHNISDADHHYNEEDISNLIGRPIFEAMPPLNPIDAPTREDKSKVVIKNGMSVFKSAQGDRSIIQYQGNYYLNIQGSILKDRKSNKLFKFDNIRKVKAAGNSETKGYLFYYKVQKNENDTKEFVLPLDSNLKQISSSIEISKNTNPIDLARDLLEAISLQED